MHHLMFLAVCLIWGTSFILMKWAKAAFEPITLAGLRVVGGAAVLVVIWLATRTRWPWRRRHVVPFAVVAMCGYLWPFTIQPMLIHAHDNSAFFGSMVSLVPIFTIAFSVPLLKLLPTRRQLIGVCGALGFMLLLLDDGLQHDIGWLHLLLAVSVPAAYAMSNTTIKRCFHDVPPLATACSAMLVGSIVLLPLGFTREAVTIDEQFVFALLCVAVLGLLGTGLATFMFYKLIQQRGPLFAGMVTYLAATISLIWGRLDSEPVDAKMVIAVLGILSMVAVVQTERPGRVSAAEAVS